MGSGLPSRPLDPIPGRDPGACPECGGWRKAGMTHVCSPPLPWLPSEAQPNRVPPRECVDAARRALDKTYGLGQGRVAIPLLIEAVDWLRRALEQMVVES